MRKAQRFIMMQTYMKRGFQGRWKQATDDLADQYDPYAITSNVRFTYSSTSESKVRAQHGVTVNGREGMITYREDSSTSTEKKDGQTHLSR